MSGISTRFIMKALDNALSDNVDGNCINPINVREALDQHGQGSRSADDTRKQYLEFLQDTLHKEYLEVLEKEITHAFVYSYQEQAEALFQNYLDHAEAFVNKTKVKDRNTQGRASARRGLPEVYRGADRDHRLRRGRLPPGGHRLPLGGEPPWRPHQLQELRAAQGSDREEAHESVRDISRIITKARTRDEEQSEKYNAMVKNLLENGYCPSCVDVVLKYAANNLWKD